MRKYLLFLLIILVNLSWNSYSQINFTDYELLIKINSPKDLELGIPSEVLLDSSLTYMIISYDYNPTILDIYKVDNWEMIKRIEIKGFTYFDYSYFHLDETSVYIDRVRRGKSKFVKVDLDSFNQTKVACKNSPRGCSYEIMTDSKIEYDEDTHTTIINYGWYILKYNYNETKIYLIRNYNATTKAHTQLPQRRLQ